MFKHLLPVHKKKRLQKGLSILEVTIGMALLGLVLTYSLTLNQRSVEQTAGRNAADSASNFQQLAAQYYALNRTAMDTAMTDGTDAATYCRVNVNADGTGGATANSTTLRTCAFDTTQLRARGVWPRGASVDTLGGRYTAIVRRIYNGTTPTGASDMLIVLAQPSGTLTPVVKESRIMGELSASMDAMGGTGGMVPVGEAGACRTVRASSTLQACGHGWQVNLSDFLSPAQLTTFSNALPN
jgi:type II secretory pathway pseudopilin PulG